MWPAFAYINRAHALMTWYNNPTVAPSLCPLSSTAAWSVLGLLSCSLWLITTCTLKLDLAIIRTVREPWLCNYSALDIAIFSFFSPPIEPDPAVWVPHHLSQASHRERGVRGKKICAELKHFISCCRAVWVSWQEGGEALLLSSE